MENGKVYWITGLAGAGKTTIGKIFYQYIKSKERNTVFLDGDELRRVLGEDLGYTREDRIKCAERYSRICGLLAGQGINVIICTISMFESIRFKNRQNIEEYIEIYVRVSKEILFQRNQKNLYSGLLDGSVSSVMGGDIQEELPQNPDIIIENDGTCAPEVLVVQLIQQLNNR